MFVFFDFRHYKTWKKICQRFQRKNQTQKVLRKAIICGRWTPHLFERRPVYQIESSSHVIKINQSQELSLRLGNPPDRNSLKFPWQALQLWGKYVWNFLHRESCVSKFVIWRTKVKIWNTNISLWNYEWNLAFGNTHPL